ncbi:Cyclic AMP-responsive element-binding protein 3-like protein 1 [Willisornis vidua]|uniref:Cyclic AMP-responsive element-binding protein 3-like protein 1 n=1 Tax=Willisornis vidua TaxID=1566151 RepID=A0ABQ9D8L8_9PASS|nr:Cyclic AMP-responsive element-binding protein 3-like protein 1 [Willisornis vidua]
MHFSENLDHFSDNMEDFSNDLFSSFFDDPVLAEKNPLLDMDLDPPTPGIQAEHSYSLSGDSAPQSPLVPVKTEDNANEFDSHIVHVSELENGVWSLGPKLCSIMVKQEQNLALDLPESQLAASSIPVLNLNPLQRLPVPEEIPIEMTPAPVIKAEPKEVNQFLNVPTVDDLVQMPPTPPSSHGSDSDGSQSPRSLPPSSPARPAARSSTAISSSPLLTAPHKLQGTSGPLLLTEEEKRTLIAEGYPIPTKLPLTKAEEKALKRVRRKIKNKISAQESRRKKKEYVECLEKKVETYTTENNELWKKVETLENANRIVVVAGCDKFVRVSYLCLVITPLLLTVAKCRQMVLALCFVLILGSLMPCLPEFSSASQTVKATPAPDIYTTSKIQSRSLLFYDEGASSLEESYSSFLTMDHPEGWEAKKRQSEEGRPHLDRTHETAKYLSKTQLEGPDQNRTDPTLTHLKEQFHERHTKSGLPCLCGSCTVWHGVKLRCDCPTALGRHIGEVLWDPVGQDRAAQEVLEDSSPRETSHFSMAEGPGSWRDFCPARSDGEVARGATASLQGAANAESTGRARRLGPRSMDPAWDEMRGAVAVTEVEEQFLRLAIRKQVSYRSVEVFLVYALAIVGMNTYTQCMLSVWKT